jgi:copper(I)-binding protein
MWAIRLAILAIPLLLATPAAAHESTVGAITIEHAWARPSTSGNGAVYMVLQNKGTSPDRLIAASSKAAKSAELDTSTVDAQGVARMRPVQAVEIPAGGEAKLTPSGTHIMLVRLAGPLKEGHGFPLTLSFEKAGTVTVDVAVERKPSHGQGAGEHEHTPMGQ